MQFLKSGTFLYLLQKDEKILYKDYCRGDKKQTSHEKKMAIFKT